MIFETLWLSEYDHGQVHGYMTQFSSTRALGEVVNS